MMGLLEISVTNENLFSDVRNILWTKELKFIHNNKIKPSSEIPEVASSARSASMGLLLDVVLIVFGAGSSLGISKKKKGIELSNLSSIVNHRNI